MKTIRIGTRESKLAVWQAEWVKKHLSLHHHDIDFVLVPMKTKGDRILDTPLPEIGDKGLFTQELEKSLLSGEIDMAVHSLKDLPTKLSGDLKIGAFCERQDHRDVFLGKDGAPLAELPEGSLIGTSSLRRKTQLQYFRRDLTFTDLRGNLDTRWRKLQESAAMAGIVLAAAGVHRLGWEDRITEYISENIILPAVGQGVIAVEIAASRADITQILEPLNHRDTEYAARAERAFLKQLEGGCQAPIGALAAVQDGKLTLRGNVTSLDGTIILETSQEGMDPETTGIEAAEKLKSLGAKELLADIRRQMGRKQEGLHE
ncbi:MAG: hydroxymethylbilane synthase [Peptococcaceae bacterium]|nr:hydroxymethylbilane synthase [Peptococcaceae bacterium]